MRQHDRPAAGRQPLRRHVLHQRRLRRVGGARRRACAVLAQQRVVDPGRDDRAAAAIKVHHRRFRTGTGGNGTHRGGNGQEVLLESRAPGPVTVAFLAERTRAEAAPAGIAGGEPGAPGELVIGGKTVDPKSQHVVEPGGTVLIRTPAVAATARPPRAIRPASPPTAPGAMSDGGLCARHRYRRHLHRHRALRLRLQARARP
ncbi:MAG: hydantoinase B/oxoprolinase family protein [Pseudomonadota bacterium]